MDVTGLSTIMMNIFFLGPKLRQQTDNRTEIFTTLRNSGDFQALWRKSRRTRCCTEDACETPR